MPCWFIITFSCHSLDLQTFELTFPVLLEVLKKNYAVDDSVMHWSIEKDETINKHIHIVINIKPPGFDSGGSFRQRLFKRVQLKPFLTYLKFTMTDIKVALDIRSIKVGEENRTVGYIYKEPILGRNNIEDAPQKYIFECVKEHYQYKKLEAIDFIEINDWKLITTKNIYSQISNYIEQNKLKYSDPNLILKMKKSFYGFVNISSKNIRRVLLELQLANNDYFADDPTYAEQAAHLEQIGVEEMHGGMITEYQDRIDILMEFIRDNTSPDEIPTKIRNAGYLPH